MFKSLVLVVLLIAGAMVPMPSAAQATPAQSSSTAEPDLDALSRRIEAAKAAAAKKEQAHKAAAEQRRAEQARAAEAAKKEQADKVVAEQLKAEQARAAEAARQAAAKQQATLVVKADADCQLTVNAEGKGKLTANQSQSIKVSPGEQLIECVTTDGTGANAQETVAAGAQAVVVLALAEAIAVKQREAQQRAAAESAARDPGNLGFFDLGGGILKDTKTGLEWTQSDNGSNIDWNGARNYCASRGGSWRLPSVDELLGIYDKTKSVSTTCGAGQTCYVSRLFRFTEWWFWSGGANGSSQAFSVNFRDGERGPTTVGYSYGHRALCVRRP